MSQYLGRRQLRKCRLCLCDDKLLIYLYEANGVFTDVAKVIMEVLQYEVFKDDRFPPYVCSVCSDKLWEFKAFKEKCDDAKESFESFLLKTEGPVQIHEEPLFLDDGIIKEELIVNDTSSITNYGNAVNTGQQEVKVFAESIVAVKMEAEDEGEGFQERNIDFYNKVFIKEEVDEDCFGVERSESPPGVREDNTESQKGKRNDFLDVCSLRSCNIMRYVNCAGQEEGLNLESFQNSQEDVAQQSKERRAIKSMCEKRNSECENVEIMASKEEEEYQSSIGENQISSQSENNRKETEDEEGLSMLETSIVKMPVKKACLIREGEYGFKCHHCGDLRETNEKLAEHIQGVHGFGNEEDKDPRNELRNSEKVNKEDIRKCLRACNNGKKHICNICNKRFTQHADLKRHIRIHRAEKPYKCSICDYRCSQNGNLKTHMRTHTAEKPYKCSICDFRCSQNGHLKQHMMIHTGEKPYKCSVCNYRCSYNGNLKKHMSIHSTEKPYNCSICNYRCSQNTDLKIHMRVHTGQKPYKCSYCDYRFSQIGHLKRHIKTHNR